MKNLFLILLLTLSYSPFASGQIVGVAHKDAEGIKALSPIFASSDAERKNTSMAIFSKSEIACTADDLVSAEWVTKFLQEEIGVSKDFEVLMIIPIKTNHVVVVGKNQDYGYFELFIPKKAD